MEHGVSIVVNGETAQLEIDVDDAIYYGSMLEVWIKNTLVDEPNWYNTTQVKILFVKPPCPVMAEDLIAAPAPKISLSAKAGQSSWVSI